MLCSPFTACVGLMWFVLRCQYDIEPPIYATGWLMTLFARGVPLPMVMKLWDFLFLQGDPVVVHFIALALIISRRSVVDAHCYWSPPVSSCLLSSRTGI